MTREELLAIIKKVEEDGFIVVAIVCDMETCHQKLASDFGVTITNPSFTHPFKQDPYKIWWFFDAPHCLKNGRNHLKDQGFKRRNEFIQNCRKLLVENSA